MSRVRVSRRDVIDCAKRVRTRHGLARPKVCVRYASLLGEIRRQLAERDGSRRSTRFGSTMSQRTRRARVLP
ncbi:MAG: hypothetical protein HOD54_00610 [Candidatus Magasanikbacteria bacterium]|jgi:hypothetical protein|nr:hypothetical protein [Candidatus Magasanikbacteria bacterium]MBT4314575.1 hypothetical protein [Candidatus Magasanikbacteria bacterium]MBT4546792.1 hypothetical protein [Candidatus Magasanikbacteria bacterium]